MTMPRRDLADEFDFEALFLPNFCPPQTLMISCLWARGAAFADGDTVFRWTAFRWTAGLRAAESGESGILERTPGFGVVTRS